MRTDCTNNVYNVNDQGDDVGNSSSINANEQPNRVTKDIEDRRSVEGSIVVVAKCPIPGKSKTRLIPLLGKEGSVRLARSMLSDVLKTIDGCKELNRVRKILLYAPGTLEGRMTMETILNELDLKIRSNDASSSSSSSSNNNNEGLNAWHLLPMLLAPSKTDDDLRSHDLGAKLEDALVRVRELELEAVTTSRPPRHGVVFLGMDAPILPLDDIVGGLQRAAAAQDDSSQTNANVNTSANATEVGKVSPPSATLCPARDGGYAMLCVPPAANPSRTFRNMYWSHRWTGMSQVKALTDQGIPVGIGSIVRDIDEASDAEELCHHLGISFDNNSNKATAGATDEEAVAVAAALPKNLEFPSGQWPPSVLTSNGDETAANRKGVISSHPTCHFTRRALVGVFGSTRNDS